MTLLRRLADHALEKHPGRAATVLERLDEGEAIRLLKRGNASIAAAIVPRLSAHYATAALTTLKPERAAELLNALSMDTAARIVRRVDETSRTAILDRLDAARARGVRSILQFAEGSAGALMDPDVLALPQELNAREALQRIRKAPDLARYNVYVVDQAGRLVGALNLRELLIARSRAPLSDLMVRDPHRMLGTADRATVLTHPGWKDVHALPVVDVDDTYLGAIRYRTFRELEEELLAPRSKDMDTAAALGQMIAAAAQGVLDALGGGSGSGQKGGGDGA